MASVYLKREVWYLQVVDAGGRRRLVASSAETKTEAKRLAAELEKRYERQRLGLEVADLPDGGGTVAELMEWWIDGFVRRSAGHEGAICSVRKHVIGSALGAIRLAGVTPGKIDVFLTEKEQVLSPKSVNHLRGYLSRAFNVARRMERFPRPNPVADVPKRKVAKHLPDYLRPHEVQPVLTALATKWQPLFATAIYTGMRKGELFALKKSDVDFAVGIITVNGSHDRDIPKSGRAEAIPINTELRVYLERAQDASRSELVFPGADGEMLPRGTKLEHVLRRAMRRACVVTGYDHKCRRQGCGHAEAHPDADLRRCPRCNFKLFPVGQVRKIRFHHLRHTTASLLLMSGADLAAVQRIMRHQDPRLTTEVYAHLATHYLKKEIDRLSFGPPVAVPADASLNSSEAAGAEEASAMGAGTAPFTTRLLPDSDHPPGSTSRGSRKRREFQKLRVVGATGFEPAAFRSRTERATRLRHAPKLRAGKFNTAKREVRKKKDQCRE